MNKTLRNITLGTTGLLLVIFLAAHVSNPAALKAESAPAKKPALSLKDSTQSHVLGLSTTAQTPASKPATSAVIAGSVSAASIQGSNSISTDAQIDPPPPVICHIYDVCGAHMADEDQGLYGTVTVGPTTPVCRIDIPCDRPYQGTVLVSNSAGEVARFTPNEQGNFRINLPPGDYKLSLLEITRLRGGPLSATVSAGLYTHLDIFFDTGIR